MSSRNSQERDNTRFPGYGDRVGSAIELAPTRWQGGEIVTDPTLITKSIKPRRFYYSPIGDGTVAADGVELKRGPVDLSPKISIIEQRIVERGAPGQAGRTIIEKKWDSGGEGGEGNLNQIEYGRRGGGPDTNGIGSGIGGPQTGYPSADDGLSSRNLVGSPFANVGLGDSLNSGPLGSALGSAPANNLAGTSSYPSSNAGQSPLNRYGSVGPLGDLRQSQKLGSHSPQQQQQQTYSTNNPSNLYENRIKSPPNGYGDNYPGSGRTSTSSALYEPGMRYEIKKDYMVTNPRELIHQYATTTPITSIRGYETLQDGGLTTQIIKQSYSSTTEESFGPYPPYMGGQNAINPKKFVQKLRDETMTTTQRQANQNAQIMNSKDSQYENKIEDIRRNNQYGQQASPNPEIDSLTNRLVTGLQTKY